jgi:hypothetical protein
MNAIKNERKVMNKKIVTQKVGCFNPDSMLDGYDVTEVIKKLNELVKTYHFAQRVYFQTSYLGYDGALDADLLIDREETDEEYQYRLEMESNQKITKAQQQEKQKEQELALFVKLKKKYEGKQ